MKNLKLGIIVLVIVIFIGITFGFTKKSKSTNQNSIVGTTENISITLTPIPTSQYSDEIKMKVRSDFINTCHTQGKYEISECNCAADYLSTKYSDIDLAKMYVEYHKTKKVPSALEEAANVCVKSD
jgi:uncharacterized protein (UPF0333 family)